MELLWHLSSPLTSWWVKRWRAKADLKPTRLLCLVAPICKDLSWTTNIIIFTFGVYFIILINRIFVELPYIIWPLRTLVPKSWPKVKLCSSWSSFRDQELKGYNFGLWRLSIWGLLWAGRTFGSHSIALFTRISKFHPLGVLWISTLSPFFQLLTGRSYRQSGWTASSSKRNSRLYLLTVQETKSWK